jgi:outer membrane protein TolC
VRIILVTCLLALAAPAAAQGPAPSGPLTLARAESRALAAHPSLAELAARIRAADSRATAAGALPDPRLSVGATNVPVDTFDLEQEPMTQLRVGLSQDFPAPGTLDLRAQRETQEGAAYRARLAETRAELTRRVRTAWLERFYLDRALDELKENLALFEELLAIARSQYRVGKGLQQEVLLAQLERDKLLDKRAELERRRAAVDSRLGELLALGRIGFRLPEALPELPDPPEREALTAALTDHPRLRTVAARIDQRTTDVSLAEKAYYPDMGVDLAYGYRPGSAPDGDPWADFATLQFRMSLPLFTEGRQDERLAAALDDKTALQQRLRRTRLALERQVRSQWAALEAARERQRLYDQSILPESEQTVEASVAAYTTGRLDFLNLVRARIQDLEHQLTRWRLRVDEEQAKAELLYLAAGEGER